jgi:ADP-ribosylation factor 2-binding protein
LVPVVVFVVYADNEFNSMLEGFLEKHYSHFEDTEENKFIYTDIFKEYVSHGAVS